MTKKIFLIVTIFLLGSILNVNAEDTVTISGHVSFSGYKNGDIVVIARKQEGTTPDFSVAISKPGEYNLKVPKNYGPVYISAVNLQAGEMRPRGDSPGGNFEQNPINVSDKDINGIDITLHRMRNKVSNLMDTYTGQTITIKGEVIFKDYKEGSIVIFANKEGYIAGGPSIAAVKISKPGKYVIKVPKNFGKIEIGALNIKQRGKSPPSSTNLRGKYKNNPIEIGPSNINDINIEIKQ